MCHFLAHTPPSGFLWHLTWSPNSLLGPVSKTRLAHRELTGSLSFLVHLTLGAVLRLTGRWYWPPVPLRMHWATGSSMAFAIGQTWVWVSGEPFTILVSWTRPLTAWHPSLQPCCIMAKSIHLSLFFHIVLAYPQVYKIGIEIDLASRISMRMNQKKNIKLSALFLAHDEGSIKVSNDPSNSILTIIQVAINYKKGLLISIS